MKIVKLDIDENSVLAGIDAVALVEQPAIEEDFIYFSKHKEEEFQETYNDYPQSVVDAANTLFSSMSNLTIFIILWELSSLL